MKKSDIYKTAIATVIGNDVLDMEDKIVVLAELFHELSVAEIIERPKNELDKTAETMLAGMPPEPVEVS